MAIRKAEFFANLEMYRQLPDDEPIVLPRLEANRRRANKEQRHKIQFDTDTTTYASFHTEKERIMLALGENPTLFGTWLCEVLGSWSDEMLVRWMEAHEGKEESLGEA